MSGTVDKIEMIYHMCMCTQVHIGKFMQGVVITILTVPTPETSDFDTILVYIQKKADSNFCTLKFSEEISDTFWPL